MKRPALCSHTFQTGAIQAPSTTNNFFTCSPDLYLCLTEGKRFAPNWGAAFQLAPVPVYSPRPLHAP